MRPLLIQIQIHFTEDDPKSQILTTLQLIDEFVKLTSEGEK